MVHVKTEDAYANLGGEVEARFDSKTLKSRHLSIDKK